MTQSPHAHNSSYLPALDGLRAVSILMVIVSHAGLGEIVPGGLGVTIFFFISGFIITRLLLKEYQQSARIQIGAFYGRRIFRILPALYVYVVICAVALYVAGNALIPSQFLAVILNYANYWEIYQGFHSGALNSPLSITWSLAVEEHYYLIYPFLLLYLLHHPRKLILTLSLLLVVVLAWRCWLVYGIGFEVISDSRIYKATDTRLDSILYGALFSILWASAPRFQKAAQSPVLFWVGAGLMLLSLLWRDHGFRETARYSVQGIALMLMFYGLILQEGWKKRLLSHPVMLYIGRISYSLYLYHWLAVVLMQYYFPTLSLWKNMAVVFAASFFMAHCSYTYVERYGLALRHRWGL